MSARARLAALRRSRNGMSSVLKRLPDSFSEGDVRTLSRPPRWCLPSTVGVAGVVGVPGVAGGTAG